MLIAELEIRHSRPIAPTRRVALGKIFLPTDPAPGPGGLLLAAVAATYAHRLDDELRDDLPGLVDDLELGLKIRQPVLRHRFQSDVVGLDRSRHRLVQVGDAVMLEHDDRATAAQNMLGAIYAAGKLSYEARPVVFGLVRAAMRWDETDPDMLIDRLVHQSPEVGHVVPGARSWALGVLGFATEIVPSRTEVLSHFRSLVRAAHPDHGATASGASHRITELTRAKRILLSR